MILPLQRQVNFLEIKKLLIGSSVKGYANLEKQLPVTEQTIFEGASMSKSVFAYFVMMFVEEGLLDLDKPLYEYLPYPDIAYDERYKKITARMALSHRTGFPNWRWDYPDTTLKIQFDPGTDYSYSGEGFQYLALVLKHLARTDWDGLEAIFQEKVARPLGMKHTVFVPKEDTYVNKAEPYDKNVKWVDWRNHVDHIRNDGVFVAAASIHTEAIDFSKWMIGLMEGKGLTEASYKEMLRDHSFVEKRQGSDVYYTLGFFKPKVPFMDFYLHGGNNYGFTCGFGLDKKSKWGYVLLTNSEYGEQLAGEMLFYLLTGPDLTPLYWRVGIVLVLLLSIVVLIIRFLIKRYRKGKST